MWPFLYVDLQKTKSWLYDSLIFFLMVNKWIHYYYIFGHAGTIFMFPSGPALGYVKLPKSSYDTASWRSSLRLVAILQTTQSCRQKALWWWISASPRSIIINAYLPPSPPPPTSLWKLSPPQDGGRLDWCCHGNWASLGVMACVRCGRANAELSFTPTPWESFIFTHEGERIDRLRFSLDVWNRCLYTSRGRKNCDQLCLVPK